MADHGGTNRFTQPDGAITPARAASLSDDALALLAAGQTAKQFLDLLRRSGLLADAVKFLAAVLPKREAVWWASQCAKTAPPPAPPEPVAPELAARHSQEQQHHKTALVASEKWCSSPTDENRRAAFAAGEPAGPGTPAGATAMAVFFADGSLAPANVPPVPAPPQACASAVAGAVNLAAVRTEPERMVDKLQAFLDLGLAVDAGANRWPQSSEPPPPVPLATAPETPVPPATPPTVIPPATPQRPQKPRWY